MKFAKRQYDNQTVWGLEWTIEELKKWPEFDPAKHIPKQMHLRDRYVICYHPDHRYGSVGPAHVNWSGCGFMPAEFAMEMASALMQAARLAVKLNREAGIAEEEI